MNNIIFCLSKNPKQVCTAIGFTMLLAFSVACSHHATHLAQSAEGLHAQEVTSGNFAGVEYKTRSKTYLAGMVNPVALQAAQKEGVTTVINLLSTEENKALPFDASQIAKNQNLTYYHFPINRAGETIDLQTLDEIEKAYMKHHKAGEKVLVHCASGGRASAWFAYHLFKTHGDTLEDSLAGAKPLGLSGRSEERIRKTLENIKR